MPDMSNQPFDHCDPEKLGRFRYAVAGMIRDLMTARLRDEPSAFKSDLKEIWYRDIKPTTVSQPALLQGIANRFHDFRSAYFGYLESEPFFEPSDTTSAEALFQRVRDLVIEFAVPDDMAAAADLAREGLPINWADLAKWNLLSELREFLNQLPEPPQPLPPSPSVPLRIEPSGHVSYQGQKMTGFSGKQFDLLKLVVESQEQFVTVEDAASNVWGNDEVGDNAIKGLIKRTNTVLQQNSVPFQLSQQAGRIRLKDAGTGNSPLPKATKSTAMTKRANKKK